jgi:hypothetical protein
VPCPEHGDPAYLWPENVDALEIYTRLNAGNHLVRHEKQGDSEVVRYYLNYTLIDIFCRAWDVDFRETLDKLEIIHKELYG